MLKVCAFAEADPGVVGGCQRIPR